MSEQQKKPQKVVLELELGCGCLILATLLISFGAFALSELFRLIQTVAP